MIRRTVERIRTVHNHIFSIILIEQYICKNDQYLIFTVYDDIQRFLFP